jgi:hypothetical protein
MEENYDAERMGGMGPMGIIMKTGIAWLYAGNVL